MANAKPSQTEQDNLLIRFDRFVVIYNPVSTNSRRSRKRIAELKDLFPSKDVKIIETSPEGLDANKKLVAQVAAKFDDKTLLCIAAGDGTVSAVLDALLTTKSLKDSSRKVPILPLWGGNANDLAYMANGLSGRTSLKSIFENGAVVPIYPLNVKLTSGKESSMRIAGCYVSFGASAYAAQQNELPKNKKRRIHAVPGTREMTEMFVVAKSLLRAKTFSIEVDGEPLPMYERIFVNGSRIAKIDRLPVRLNEKAFYEASLERKHPRSFISLLSALKILRNRTYGEVTEKDKSFVLGSDTWGQIDGEVMQMTKGTKVEISLSKTPFYVVSTKLM
jgi:hypothetical protein